MGTNPLTNQVAAKALHKLDATDETQRGDPHPTYAIYHNGRIVARTGLRRSSRSDIPVPHVKRDLRVNVHFILELGRCSKDKNDWLKAVGEIPLEDSEEKGEQGASSSES